MQAVIEQPGTVDEAVARRAARARARSGRDRARDPAVEDAHVGRARRRLPGHVPAADDRGARGRLSGGRALPRRRTSSRISSRVTWRHTPRRATRSTGSAGASRSSSGCPAASARRRFVADLARLELAVTEVFDAPESSAWPADEIAALPAGRLGEGRSPADRRVSAGCLRVSGQRVPPVGQGRRPRSSGRRAQADVRRRVAQALRGLAPRSLEAGPRLPRRAGEGPAVRKGRAAAARGLQGDAGDQLFRWLRDWVAEGMFQGIETA